METYHRGLHRSSNQAIIGGVAAGIAEHLKTDPTIIRILFAILAMFGGGLLIYIILWIALPAYPTSHFNAPQTPYTKEQEKSENPDNPDLEKPVNTNTNGGLIAGLIMICIGLIFLIDQYIPTIHFHDLWPIILLIIGGVLIKSAYSNPKS